jgi:leucyl-tRNA synthetase
VQDSDLPVTLPEEVDFEASGRSPLTYYEPFLKTETPDGKPARRETDTMDTFMCSSWYHYRYLSPSYDQHPFDPEEAAYWLPVDVYTGGAEHATMHLLYTRFFTKVMRDLNMFNEAVNILQQHGRDPEGLFDEPMLMLRNQGQILGEARPGHYILASGTWDGDKLFADRVEVINRSDAPSNFDGVKGEIIRRTERILTVAVPGQEENTVTVEVLDNATIDVPEIEGENNVNQLKHRLEIQRMSKSKGNVVNPDELVQRYGADTVRAYLMFAFDWMKGGPWNSQDIKGVVRWINDVWALVMAGAPSGDGDEKVNRDVLRKAHQTIDRVTTSMDSFSFNTAVAALMELKNALQDAMKTSQLGSDAWYEAVRILLLLMAPISPFVAEELWACIGGAYSIHTQNWPEYDADIAAEDEIELVVQVNGKVREKFMVPADISEADAKAQALNSENVQKYLEGKEPKKVIYIANRGMINIVV